jgi:paired amphipathic helix protein Sin3a
MNTQPPHGPPNPEHEREMEEHRERERQILRQQEEVAQREREHVDREREAQRQHREYHQPAPPHQNTAGGIPLHQPVASRLPGAIHSPGGLLANHGGVAQAGPLGAPNGPGNVFGGPLHAEAGRSMQQLGQSNPQQPQQHQIFGGALGMAQNAAGSAQAMAGPGPAAVFGGPLQQDAAARSMQQMPFQAPGGNGQGPANQGALGQGQQPILNVSLLSSPSKFCF